MRPRKRRKPKQQKRKPERSRLASPEASLQSLLAVLRSRSYFDLTSEQRKALRRTSKEFGFKIKGWSIVPHPSILEALRVAGSALIRRILTIETLRATIYFAVRDFLIQFDINVSSYYSGGSADFICDLSLTDQEYTHFYEKLINVLVKAGAGRLEDVENLVSVFRVDKELILSACDLSRFGKLDIKILQRVTSDRARFEAIYRDYSSKDALAFFPNERARAHYVKELFDGHAIVGFQPLFDSCRFIDREYVPLCHGRVLERMLKNGRGDTSIILKPVVELLSVRPEKSEDEVDREVTHIFINEYSSPGERNAWKTSIYEQAGDDLNLFSYPIEGSINEFPLVLSNLPEVVSRAREYSGAIHLGVLSHPTSPPTPPVIALDISALAFQGVTLGIPGSGKTNTDCVLISEIAEKIDHIVIADTIKSHSIRDKHEAFPESVKAKIKYFTIELEVCKVEADLEQSVKEAFLYSGISVIEAPEGYLPTVVDVCLDHIEEGSPNTANKARRIEGMLLVEEANDAFSGNDRRERIEHLERVLRKASRKGWCIWLSTHHLADLGFDSSSVSQVLRMLQNWLIHQPDKDDLEEIQRMLNGTASDGTPKWDFDLTRMLKGTAIVRGTRDDGGMMLLPPIMTKIEELGKKLESTVNI